MGFAVFQFGDGYHCQRSLYVFLVRLVSVVVLLEHLLCCRLEQAYVSDTTADNCTQEFDSLGALLDPLLIFFL